ncbi:MAG TPA: patatin-like phospholipase family protein [Terriglobales bacterium]|nr:patatin-like phospholipase family protein [Terriglobales bacterium]
MLERERSIFRDSLPLNPAELWQDFQGRIAVVLSGGGARGAYEAGVLLAFQDARLPTHILASTSIGAINAASYAAHSNQYVGNAESLVKSWSEVNPPAVGIDWSRYILVLAGLTAVTGGFGNFILALFHRSGIYLHLHTPLLTWFLLGVAGLSIVFFYSQISYLFYVFMKFVRHYQWRPDRHKVALSSLANLIVWGFVLLVLTSTDLHFTPRKIFEFTPKLIILLAAVVLVGGVVWALFRSRISLLSHKLLQSPLRPGLFPNYERTRFLRDRIPEQGLRASPIRVVMTASNLDTGDERFFVNKPTTELERDPGVDVAFIREKLEHPDDLIKCVVASSAFPMAYEPVEMQGRLWSDGALVAKQPIFPAIRLGADVLFLVMVEPASEIAPRIKTFLDVGIRAFDILMSRNLQADLRILDNVNQICEAYAAKLGTRPEHLRLEIGTRTMRFLKAFTVRPASPLAATLLDFDGAIARPAMEQGYNDGARVVREFIDYVAQLPATSSKYVLRLVAEQVRGSGMGD